MQKTVHWMAIKAIYVVGLNSDAGSNFVIAVNIVLHVYVKLCYMHVGMCFNSLGPRQNCRHFADGIIKWIFLNENIWITLKISLKFVPQVGINNISALIQIMAWCRPGDKPLSEPMLVSLLTHICVAWPQWVNRTQSRTHPERLCVPLHLHKLFYFSIKFMHIISAVIMCDITSKIHVISTWSWWPWLITGASAATVLVST